MEVHYDDPEKRVIEEPVQTDQQFCGFEFVS